jgi:hypothetical protein
MSRFLLLIVLPVLAIALFFSDNIRGYYRFKDICAKDAGLHVYVPLKRDVGWVAREIDAPSLLHFYEEVNFVRHSANDHTVKDLVRTPDRSSVSDNGFRTTPPDPSKQPTYSYQTVLETVASELRMYKRGAIVTEVASEKVVATFQDYVYTFFETNWGPAQGTSCSAFNSVNAANRARDSEERFLKNAFIEITGKQ